MAKETKRKSQAKTSTSSRMMRSPRSTVSFEPQEGDVVRVITAGPDSELGRVCRLMPITCKVQFETLGCRQVRKADLELAEGNAPECDGNCT